MASRGRLWGPLYVLLVAGCDSGVSGSRRGLDADARVDGDGDGADAGPRDSETHETASDVRAAGDAVAHGGADSADSADSKDAALPFESVTLPAALAVPPGATLKVRYHGVGTQVYACASLGSADAGGDAVLDGAGDASPEATADAAGDATSDAPEDAPGETTSYSWVLVGPNAVLFDVTGTEVGACTGGPTVTSLTWTSKDGSAVTASVQTEQSVSSDAIPWLVSSASSHAGTGVFSDVTYVQGVNTMGGLAPAVACAADLVGTTMSTGYTADYYFYTGVGAMLSGDASPDFDGGDGG